ncbi:MAG: carbon monoxide dehydrogenase subunit G [Rhodospirillales bacterium]|nr:carbon monoxide dehydrogenase subunit G [Rhodospirillales bacterium]
MELDGEYLVEAAPEAVWRALNDAAVLAACIPGCRSLEQRSDSEFAAIVEAKIGPLKAAFAGTMHLSEVEAPHACTLRGEGKGAAAGFARGSARVTLEAENGATRLRWRAKAEVGGKLASIGNRLVAGAARKMAADFFDAFARSFIPTSP